MSTATNKALVRRWHEEVWKGSQTIFDEVLAPDCVLHGIGGPQDIQAAITSFLGAFPDARLTIDEMITEADKVVTRWTVQATHQGEWMGIAPTGKPITYTCIAINRIAGGKIVEDRFEADSYGLMQQLGAIPMT